MQENQNKCEQEFDFALVLDCAHCELTEELENSLYDAGCDDATISILYGAVVLEFSRIATSFKDAILSAFADVEKAGCRVARIDTCNLVTQAEIARRVNRSRETIRQYISGDRGPGGFPPPVCYLREDKPLWQWCAVGSWLVQNNMIRQEVLDEALIIDIINMSLEISHHREGRPELVAELTDAIMNGGCCPD